MRLGGRALTYGLLGWGIEVVYTATKEALKGEGDGKLRGESYVWMAPIYAAGGLAGEAVVATLGGRPVWERGLAYAGAFWAVEASSGEALRRLVGDVPWGEDYRRYRDNLGGGLIRLSYLPNWAVAGLALERVTPLLKRLRLEP
ncbi:MAG: hypothetical protein M3527_08405 [Actinomycetota bacterium]|nr:hypothetical protein [Acidimicrobiia bacterium]MDQ3294455.1 hypothetical protein [Actinomycetota bacterium]